MENIITPLAKSVLISLGLNATASEDEGIHKKKKMLGSGCRSSFSALRPLLRDALHKITPIISNDEIGDIIKIVKSLEDPGLLSEGVSETIQNEAKEQKRRILSMLLGT